MCIRDRDGIAHVLAIQHLAALFVDDLTLLIVNLVVIKKILTNTEVVKLNLLLCLVSLILQTSSYDLLYLSIMYIYACLLYTSRCV